MSLYLHNIDEGQLQINIYARNPRHIVDLIKSYQRKVGSDTAPPWLKNIPEEQTIPQVEHGKLYLTPRIDLERNVFKLLFAELQVCDDFSVFIDPLSIYNFENIRRGFQRLKREDLYKVQIRGPVFEDLTFIPEDVAEAMIKFDIEPLIQTAKSEFSKVISSLEASISDTQTWSLREE